MFDIEAFIKSNLSSDNPKTQKIVSVLLEMGSRGITTIGPRGTTDNSVDGMVANFFVSRLASIEFGYVGWTFCCGSHRSITDKTALEAEKFGQLYGAEFGASVPIASGATNKFMEIINKGYGQSGHDSITSTFDAGYENGVFVGTKVNREVRHCVVAPDFVSMNNFLSNNAVAGIFFEGGIGTLYECVSLLYRRRLKVISENTPIIFVSPGLGGSPFYDLFVDDRMASKIYPEDLDNFFIVDVAEQALEILSGYRPFVDLEGVTCDIKHPEIREMFAVSKEDYF